MTHEEVKTRLQDVYRQVFKNPSMVIEEAMTAADIEGWDSVAHIDLVLAVEAAFDVEFSTTEIGRMKNIGDFLRLIEKRSAK